MYRPDAKLLLAIILIPLCGCSTQTMVSGLALSPAGYDFAKDIDDQQSIKVLSNLSDLKAADGRYYLRDWHLITTANQLSTAGSYKKSSDFWYRSFAYCDESSSSYAIQGLAKTLALSDSQLVNPRTISAIIQQELKNRSISATTKKIVSNDKRIEKLAQIALKHSSITQIESTITPPNDQGVSSSDPLLKQIAKSYCAHKGSKSYQWDAWVETLPSAIQEYWHALAFQCSAGASIEQKLSLWRQSYSQLSTYPRLIAYQIESLRHLILLLRHNDRRHDAAEKYLVLVSRWLSPEVSHELNGWSQESMTLARINDFLWAARYRALIGDYSRALTFANLAQNYVDDAYGILPDSSENRNKLAILKAEALQIRLFRVAAAQKDFAHASYLATIGSTLSDLDKQWINRFLWYRGFFLYLDKKTNSAIKTWTELKKQSNHRMRDKVHFWLARALMDANRLGEAQQLLDTLSLESPLSFYNVVAPQLTNMYPNQRWQTKFPTLRQMKAKFQQKRRYRMSDIHENEKTHFWLRKSELLVSNHLALPGQKTLQTLRHRLDRVHPARKNIGAHLYLSRLQFAAGATSSAIRRTTQLLTHESQLWDLFPEQLLVYYPAPFRHLFKRNADQMSVDINLLLAIARQESAFAAAAESPAGAYGIMQLIPKTAQRFLETTAINQETIRESLFKPSLNIQLGSRYLAFLRARYKSNMAATIAAYNAGEYAVDLWLNHRGHDDVLSWIELIPFGESQEYVKSVWRNRDIYRFLQESRLKKQTVQSRAERRAFISRR